MSIPLALGIVAVVNLAIGYALALLIDPDHGGADQSTEAFSGTTSNPIVESNLNTTTVPLPIEREADNETTVSSSASQMPPVKPEEIAQAAAAIKNAAVSVQPVDASAAEDDQRDPVEASQPTVDVVNATAEFVTPVGVETQPPAKETTPADPSGPVATDGLTDQAQELNPETVPGVSKTTANCERWLGAAEELLREERELPPASKSALPPVEEPQTNEAVLQPRATLADAARLEAAITTWWENDPHRTRPICVGQIEIDNLRQLTAELGASVAGNLAKQIEARVLNMLRRDDLVASLGRSRFLVVFPNADGPSSARLVDQLRRRLEATEFTQQERAVRTTLTGGIAQATADESVESVLARAAEALAEARAKGRNRVVWHDGMVAALVETPSTPEVPERVEI